MSEKQFIKLKSEWVDINFPIIWDTYNETGLNVEQTVNVLNEQQATIEQKDKEIKGLEEKIQRIYVNVCSAMSEVIDDE